MVKKWISKKEGFTLIEVIIAMAITGVFIIPISYLLSFNIKLNSLAKDQVLATNIAENIIEDISSSEDVREFSRKFKQKNFNINVESVKVKRDEQSDEIEEGNIARGDIYKIIVTVKKSEKIIERLMTYKITQFWK